MKMAFKITLRLLVNILLAFDQLVNTFPFLGHPDETLSSRLGRTVGKERYFWVKWFRVIVDTIFFFDKKVEYFLGEKVVVGHCQKSVMPLEQQNFRDIADYEIWSWCKGELFGDKI